MKGVVYLIMLSIVMIVHDSSAQHTVLKVQEEIPLVENTQYDNILNNYTANLNLLLSNYDGNQIELIQKVQHNFSKIVVDIAAYFEQSEQTDLDKMINKIKEITDAFYIKLNDYHNKEIEKLDVEYNELKAEDLDSVPNIIK